MSVNLTVLLLNRKSQKFVSLNAHMHEPSKIFQRSTKTDGVENNFKSVEQMRARTCSRNHSIRVFMFFLSMTVCNLWYTAVRKMNNMMETGRRRRVKINITANVFLALLIVLVKKIITSVNKELEYYLQCVR